MFGAIVKVEVAADGKPVKVEAPASYPQGVRDYIERRVGSWKYTPATDGGVPVPATTYVNVGVCAIPVAQGYKMGLDFKGNGPGLVTSGPWEIPPPPHYPVAAMKAGVGGAFRVVYETQADEKAKLVTIESLGDAMGKRYEKVFRKALEEWVGQLRFHPELVNGKPVVTSMSMRMQFTTADIDSSANEGFEHETKQRQFESKECTAAAIPGTLQPLAENSPVKVTPVPAS